MKGLREILLEQAEACDVCAEGREQILTQYRRELMDYYFKMIDWCLENHFPKIDTISEYFGKCEEYGAFVNKTFRGEVLSEKQAYVFHNCKGWIRVAMDYENNTIPMLYFANNTRLTIKCDQERNKKSPIKVPLYIYDAKVKAEDNDFAQYRVYNRKTKM